MQGAAPLADDLYAAVGAGGVSTLAEDRQVYARDLWARGLIGLAAGAAPPAPPEFVVWPRSTAEVQAVVRACRARRVPLVPYGAGSGVCGGAAPTGGVVLDTKRMRRVLAIDEARMTVTFQPGILGTHLEAALARRGLTLGHFPSSIMCSTAGGWVATRGAGQCSTRYGKIEDMVQGLELVTGTGEALRLPGEIEGLPDLVQLIVGSEGTLGVITEVTCAVRRAPAVRRMRGWNFPFLPGAITGVRRLLQLGLRPAVVRLYDELDTLVSRQEGPGSRPGGAAAMSLESGLDEWLEMLRPDVRRARRGLERWLVQRALARPALLNRLAERLAPRLSTGCVLILGFEGDEALCDAEARAAEEALREAGGRDLGPGPGEHWLAHRYDVSFKMPRAYAAGAFVDTCEVASTWERLLPLYQAVREAVSPLAFVMAHFSHAYPDGCSIYFTFAARRAAAEDPARVGDDEGRYDELWRRALSAAVRAGGTISHHHGIGRLKAPFMSEEHGRGMALYRALKQVLDPDGVLNPGKMGLDTRPEGAP